MCVIPLACVTAACKPTSVELSRDHCGLISQISTPMISHHRLLSCAGIPGIWHEVIKVPQNAYLSSLSSSHTACLSTAGHRLISVCFDHPMSTNLGWVELWKAALQIQAWGAKHCPHQDETAAEMMFPEGLSIRRTSNADVWSLPVFLLIWKFDHSRIMHLLSFYSCEALEEIQWHTHTHTVPQKLHCIKHTNTNSLMGGQNTQTHTHTHSVPHSVHCMTHSNTHT